MERNIKFFDVENLADIPNTSKDKKYLEFLGGTKKYRCFLVDKKYPRCDFYKYHIDLIDPILHPIYQNKDILISQDNTFPLPGFYILYFDKQYKSIDELSNSTLLRSANLLKILRKAMRQVLGIKSVNIYYEEKLTPSNNVHFWVMPKTEKIDTSKKLYELDLNEYLNGFDFLSNKKIIKEYNDKLRKHFEKIELEKMDDEIFNKFNSFEKKINLCISNECFLKCLGCYNNFSHSALISYEEISKFLDYAKNKGLEKVTLSGGDPLTRIDIVDIINKCLELNLKVNLDTVGLPFIEDSKIVDENRYVPKFEDFNLLKKISMIGIPIDGSSNEICNKFRKGKDDLFEKQLQILDILEKQNLKICVNTVFHKENILDIDNIYSILKKYNCIQKWQVFQYMPIGPMGKLNEKKFQVEKSIFLKYKEKYEKKSNKKLEIEFKIAEERSCNYMLINSNGAAYKVDLSNNNISYGNINDPATWENIMKNLC